MTEPLTLAARTVAALRSEHDTLARVVDGLSSADLDAVSGASEWTVAQVLSHLGSGAEISLATMRVAVSGAAPLPDDFNQGVWDRWNAMAPADQAAGSLRQDEELVAMLEGLSTEQRETTMVDMGFLPAPLPLGSAAGMRLDETAMHGWDVRVTSDPSATVDEEVAAVLADHFSGGLGFLLGFLGKPDAAGPAVVAVRPSGHTLVVGESVRLDGPGDAGSGTTEPDATFEGPVESLLRLITGRLSPDHTPGAVSVTGAVGLDDLRRAFPGF